MKMSVDIEFYTRGACDSFALAMAKRFNLQIKVMWSNDRTILHAWLISRSGREFDARGFVSEESVIRRYRRGGGYLVEVMTAAELEGWIGEGEWEEDALKDIERCLEYYEQFLR